MKSIKLKLIVFNFILTTFVFPHVVKADSLSFVSRTKFSDYPWGVTDVNKYLYIPNRGTISIVDITNRDIPVYIKNFDPNANALALFRVDTIIYCRGASTFTTVSITDPINPVNLYWKVIVGSSDYPRGIFVVNKRCYLTLGDHGVPIYDITNPSAPDSIGAYDTPGFAFDIVVRDTLAYIADMDSLQIVNIKVPNACVRVSAVAAPNWCHGVAISGNYAYIACKSGFGFDGRVLEIDISDPANPVVVDSINNIQGDPLTAFYAGNYIYCIAADYNAKKDGDVGLQVGCKEKATVEGGLRVINVAKPDSIYYACGFNTFSDPRDAIAESGYVYIADQDSGLLILKHIYVTGVDGKPVPGTDELLPVIFPNPTSNIVNIEYTVKEKGEPVEIRIYNISGQLVRTLDRGVKGKGKHTAQWDLRDNIGGKVPNGSFIFKLTVSDKTLVKKLIVIK
jgi:hypothetical protein